MVVAWAYPINSHKTLPDFIEFIFFKKIHFSFQGDDTSKDTISYCDKNKPKLTEESNKEFANFQALFHQKL